MKKLKQRIYADKEFRKKVLLIIFLIGVFILLNILFVIKIGFMISSARLGRDPLYATIEEDPCYQDGVFYISNRRDYYRFVGYINRADKEKDVNSKAIVSIDAMLLSDINLEKGIGYGSLKGHPYVRQSIMDYEGKFEGNGHTITFEKDRGNGMFVCLARNAEIKNLTIIEDNLVWGLDEYGVGLVCAVNYGLIQNVTVKGSITATKCYAGGIAGMNRGTIENCKNYAAVKVTEVGDYGAGGIAGISKCVVLNGESEQDPIPAIIKNCINYGTIEAPWEAGGICAYNDCADIYDCGNEGEVRVQYERGYIAPLHPEWYEYALAGGICGNMGHNSIQNCYNIGKISILEDGNEATYGIAGDTMEWTSSIKNCVSLKGAAVGNMRHESIMELSESDMQLWREDHDSIPYEANNWQFDLEEAKSKLSLKPLGATESGLTIEQEDMYLCSQFSLKAPFGYVIREVSPYALCIEADPAFGFAEPLQDYQVWLLNVNEAAVNVGDITDEFGAYTEDNTHELWREIEGSRWLHPSKSYKDDGHVEWLYSKLKGARIKPEPWLVHYRDDFMAMPALQDERGVVDNVVAIPMEFSSNEGKGEQQIRAKWILLFTNQKNNLRPELQFVQNVMDGFTVLPLEFSVSKGDTLSAIAFDYTGDKNRYREILSCNDIEDENKIIAGQMLTLPWEWLAEQ